MIKAGIKLRHLQQLQNLDLIRDETESFPIFATYGDITQWTKDSMDQITKAVGNRKYRIPVYVRFIFTFSLIRA